MPTINDADVLCPFYQSTTEKGIICEGITDNNEIKLLFNEIKHMHSYRKIYCCGRYADCKIHSMLEMKYAK